MMVTDRRVVVTGKIVGETRDTAEQKLREAGAIVQDKVGKTTDLLVAGANVGQRKLNDAKANEVDVITWEQAFGDGELGNYTPPSAPRAPMPRVKQWAPMLCTQADELPAGDGWIYEVKWDGIRGVATVKNGGVMIQSRRGKMELTERYPFVTNDLEKLSDCVLDGELVDIGSGPQFIVFDILEDSAGSCRDLTYFGRRSMIGALLGGADTPNVAICPYFTDGEVLLKWVIENKHEGVVAKRASAPYVENQRGPNWLKIKVRLAQEFIVLGYTKGEGAREATLGALVLGYREKPGVNQPMLYAGRVGTGWDTNDLTRLRNLLEPLKFEEIKGCPWEGFPKLKNVTWVHPEVVVDVAFQKWTPENVIYHSSWQGVREDKLAEDVVRET